MRPLLIAVSIVILTASVDSTCTHGTPTEAFASAYYAALAVTHPRNGLSIPGDQAADIVHRVLSEILAADGQCNADWVAFTASRGVGLVANLTLANYERKTAYTIGGFFESVGLLRCDNAVRLTLRAFQFVRRAFEGLDDAKFESYARAIVQGLLDFAKDLGLKIGDVSQKMADLFYEEFRKENHDQCMAGQPK